LSSDAPSSSGHHIRVQAGQGLVWNGLSAIVGQILRLVSSVVVARLLGPETYGLIGIALMVTNGAMLFQDMGFSLALIQSENLSEETKSAAFWLNVLISVGLCVLVLALAPMVAGFFAGEVTSAERMRLVLAALAPIVVTTALGSVHTSLLQRGLAFRSVSLSQMGGGLVEAGVTIGVALGGGGVWALVIGIWVRECVRLTLLWLFSPWRPRLRWRLAALQPLLRFGINAMGTRVMLYFRQYFDGIVIGRALGEASFGIYSMAFQWAMFPRMRLVPIVRQVMLPVLSRLQCRMEHLRATYTRLLGLVGLGVLPVSTGMFLVSDDLVLTVYGPAWSEAVFPLRVLCLGALAVPVASTAASLLMAVGRADLDRRLTWLSAALFGLLVVVGARWRLQGVAVAVGAELWLFALAQAWGARTAVGLRFKDLVCALWPAAAGCLLMAVVVPAWRFAAVQLGLSDLARLVVAVALGAGTYVLALRLLAQAFLSEVLTVAQEALPVPIVDSMLWQWVRVCLVGGNTML
jgi:O-antigen/teichoic acid export membrane protein